MLRDGLQKPYQTSKVRRNRILRAVKAEKVTLLLSCAVDTEEVMSNESGGVNVLLAW